MTRHFLRDDDLSSAEQYEVLKLAIAFKRNRFLATPFAGPRAVAVLFDKSSTRTRVSFSVGIAELGGYPLVIDSATSQLGRGEPISDTARVLDRECAAIVWRTFGQERIEAMAEASSVPVINALTDSFHPCQILADLQTIAEHRGGLASDRGALAGRSIAYLGDGSNNMAQSYILGGAVAGLDVRIASPAKYQPEPSIVRDARTIAEDTGAKILITADADAALDGVDAVATDTWVSMGSEAEKAERESALSDYCLDADKLSQAKADALVLHCLPAYRGLEITAEVLDGPQSVVWDQAENRLHAQKALLTFLSERSS